MRSTSVGRRGRSVRSLTSNAAPINTARTKNAASGNMSGPRDPDESHERERDAAGGEKEERHGTKERRRVRLLDALAQALEREQPGREHDAGAEAEQESVPEVGCVCSSQKHDAR